MSGMECELCARPSGDDAPVCTSCAADCASALTQIHGDGRTHGLDVDLDIATARQDQLGDGNTGNKPTKPSEAPLPINPHASEAAAVLRSTLVGWVRIIHDELGGTWPADTLAGMARWLAPLCGWARHTAYAAEMVDEILAAVHQARRAIDRPIRRVPLHVSCRGVTLDGHTPIPCEGELVAILAPGLPSDGQVRCTSGEPDHTTTVQALTDRRRGARPALTCGLDTTSV